VDRVDIDETAGDLGWERRRSRSAAHPAGTQRLKESPSSDALPKRRKRILQLQWGNLRNWMGPLSVRPQSHV